MLLKEKPKKKRGPKNKNRANGIRTESDELIKEYGNLLLGKMSEDEKGDLTSKSGTLKFIRILGLDSRNGSNTEPGVLGYDEKTGKPKREGSTNAMLSIGVELVSDEDIVVPRIRMDITKRLFLRGEYKNFIELEFVEKLGNRDYELIEYDENEEVSFERIEAGKKFTLSTYETMFLLLRPEYGALLALGDDDDDHKGAQLKLRFDNSIIQNSDGTLDLVIKEGMVKLPTPSIISFSKNNSLKKKGIPVDQRLPNGTYEIRPEYIRFAELVSRTGSVRSDKKIKKQEIREAKEAKAKGESLNTQSNILLDAPDPTLLTLALQESILSNKEISNKTKEALIVEGKKILTTIDEERRIELGCKSDTLRVMNSLYFGKKPIGLTLKSDIDIEVPLIPVTSAYREKGYVTKVEISDVSSQKVNADEEFVLTFNEFTLLIIRDEYAGFCAVKDTSKGCFFSPKLIEIEKYIRLIPRVEFSKHLIHFSNQDISTDPMSGPVTIKPKYLPKFQDLI